MSIESVTLNPAAVLFDMDGTLIDSSPAVVAAWQLMQETYPFLDLDHILASAHGYRTTDALRKWCLIEDDEKLASEVMRFEKTILSEAKKKGEAGGQGIIALPGVKQLLSQLDAGKETRAGKEGWAICTSSTHFYASQAIPTAGLPEPKIFVTAESVQNGKPAPDPYLLGAEKSETTADRCVVVEDAPTGIRSGKASGAIVLATCTSHSRASLEREKPDFLVDDLTKVSAEWIEGVLHLTITQPADRASPAPTPLQTPVASRAGSPKLRAASFGMSSLPDAASFAKKMLGGSMTPATNQDERTTPPQTPGASDDVHGAKGLSGIGGI